MLITVPTGTAATLKSLLSTPQQQAIANLGVYKYNVIIQPLTGAAIYFETCRGIPATVATSVQIASGSSLSMAIGDLSDLTLITTVANADVRVDVSSNIG
jgi:hypothetical protein